MRQLRHFLLASLLVVISGGFFSGLGATPDSDFAARCSAPGVIKCEGFDGTAVFAPSAGPIGLHNVSPVRAFQDTAVKHSGASSLRFDIAGNTPANVAGDFVAALGQSFGQNSTFYIQYQQMMDSQMVSFNWGSTGNGVSPKSSIVYGAAGTTCQKTQFVTAAFGPIQPGFKPAMYSECGQRNMYTNLAGTAWACPTCTPLLIQQGGYNCQYGNYSNCFSVPANKWVTWYYKIHVGTWGAPNSTVDAWVAVDGGSYKQWIKVPNFTFFNDYQSQDNNFSKIMLTPYMTGKNSSISHPVARTWYDELIVSTQPIAAPGGGSAPPGTPPPTPTPTPTPTPQPSAPPPATGVTVTQKEPQPMPPGQAGTPSAVSVPLLIGGVIVAALLLDD